MAVEIITKDDLLKFKQEFFAEFKQILQGHNPDQKQWLKSYEVREMLGFHTAYLKARRFVFAFVATNTASQRDARNAALRWNIDVGY